MRHRLAAACLAGLAGLAVAAPITGPVAEAAGACSGGAWSRNVSNPSVRPISRAAIIERGRSWISAPGTEYCTAQNYTNKYGTYRRDCSGFVSMAWGLPTNYGTASLPSLSTRLSSFSRLQPGDVVIRPRTSSRPGHVMLFVRWAGSGRGVYWHEASAGRRALETVSSSSSLINAGYARFQYVHITGSGGPPAPWRRHDRPVRLVARPRHPEVRDPGARVRHPSNGVRTLHGLTAKNNRPDLVGHYPAAGALHGCDTVISGLPAGRTRVDVYAIDSSNRANDHSLIGTRWVDVP